MFECKYCGRTSKNLNSQRQHEVRCSKNPERKDYNKLGQYVQRVRSGQTKYTCDEVKQQSEKLRALYRSGELTPYQLGRPGTFLGRHHTDECKRKIGDSVSKTRKKHYSDGTLSPARGVGRGKYSYIVYEDKKYMCRSTYEFIFALYLLEHNIRFEMEAIRVPAARDNPFSSTFISDFSYDNRIIEVKGIKSGKDYYIREAFAHAGYEFIELYESDIMQCKQWLQSKDIDIDGLIQKIIDGHDRRQYFVYTYEK